LTDWAGRIGAQTRALVAAILADRPHPKQGYRSCLGLLRLGRRHGEARLEAACARALAVGARSYRHVDSILRAVLHDAPNVLRIVRRIAPGRKVLEDDFNLVRGQAKPEIPSSEAQRGRMSLV